MKMNRFSSPSHTRSMISTICRILIVSNRSVASRLWLGCTETNNKKLEIQQIVRRTCGRFEYNSCWNRKSNSPLLSDDKFGIPYQNKRRIKHLAVVSARIERVVIHPNPYWNRDLINQSILRKKILTMDKNDSLLISKSFMWKTLLNSIKTFLAFSSNRSISIRLIAGKALFEGCENCRLHHRIVSAYLRACVDHHWTSVNSSWFRVDRRWFGKTANHVHLLDRLHPSSPTNNSRFWRTSVQEQIEYREDETNSINVVKTPLYVRSETRQDPLLILFYDHLRQAGVQLHQLLKAVNHWDEGFPLRTPNVVTESNVFLSLSMNLQMKRERKTFEGQQRAVPTAVWFSLTSERCEVAFYLTPPHPHPQSVSDLPSNTPINRFRLHSHSSFLSQWLPIFSLLWRWRAFSYS